MSRESARVALGLILLLAVGLFVCGIDWGLPGNGWDFDEITPRFVNGAREHGVAAGWPVKYPPLQFYLVAPLYALIDRALAARPPDAETMQMWHFLGSRGVSVVMGILTVLVVYRASRQLNDRAQSLFAALVVALFVPMVVYSKLGNLDVPYLFWFSLSLLFLLRLLRRHRLGDYLAMACTAAAAVATKDQAYGLYLLTPLAIVPALARARRAEGRSRPLLGCLLDRRVVLAVAAGAFLFLLVHGVFRNPAQFVRHFDRITGPYSANVRFFEKSLTGHWQMAKLSWRHAVFSFGWPLWVACLGGVVAVLRPGGGTNRPLFAVLLLMAASYYLTFLSVILYQYDRFHLPFAVLLAPFGGYLLGRFGAAAVMPRWLRMAALAAVFAYSAVRAFEIDWLMRHDTRYTMERLVATRAPGVAGVLGIGQAQMLPRTATLHPRAVLRNGGTALDRAGAGYLVVNATAQWDRSGQAVRAGLLDRRYPFRRIAVVPRGRAPLQLLDREGIISSLYFVSPELELYQRLAGDWADWAIAQSQGRVADLLRYAAEERQRGRYSEARRLDEAAAASDPTGAAPVLGLGLDALGLGRSDEAESWLRRAESLDPGWSEPAMALARLLVVQGCPDEAWQASLRAVDRAGESAEPLLLVASIAARTGRRQLAWNLAREVEGGLRERTDAPGLARLAEVYRSLGAECRALDTEGAVASLAAASESPRASRERQAMSGEEQ